MQNIYVGLFKNMMEWVSGFMKKHKGQQVFDNAGKEIPPYHGFIVAKRPIATSHNGMERRCAISAIVFQPYWRPQCDMRKVLSIMISIALGSVLAHW